ncbi:uncharacterized protein LOC141537012 [Cotesia typhae]|uniref:uncharacterized protein LOC141537012 n=1 Tax=Cotesia typhae TaxID=2053667 RepID=UPI003D690E24
MNTATLEDKENDLQSIVKLLLNTYDATVDIYNDSGEDKCKGIFFSTPEMRQDVKIWPEIIFIDGTYKLTDNDLTTMVIAVEDGNGRGQIGGIGLLATEERDVLEWMLKVFQRDNEEAFKNVKAFMTDKDLTERSILKELFPAIPSYICLYHTLKIFKGKVEDPKMRLTKEQQIEAKMILDRIARSQTQDQYDELYYEFCRTSPEQLVEYYNFNWHNITEDWVNFNYNKNLGNRTNNRVESINAKLKSVLHKRSPTIVMIENFFEWYASHKSESTFRTANQFLKTCNNTFLNNSLEQLYIDYLTKFASDRVLVELQNINNILITYFNKKTMTCTVADITFLNVTPTSCECALFLSMNLPCKHIFAYFKYWRPAF